MKALKKNFIDEFIDKSKSKGLKITPQRIAIYKELIKSSEHPSAETVYKKLHKKYPNISFDTVNRTLITFSNIGLLQIVEGYGDPKRFDPNTESHHHFRCIKCGSISDFSYKEYNELKIPENYSELEIRKVKVILEGICKKCKNKKDFSK
ncbi:MAG: transcriptional repressor [Thermodesulfovibrionales bacterium]|nr:transcriptional repressor [Thermodesulfovibrionales bacterium]